MSDRLIRNTLHGTEGELVSIRIHLDPRSLEDALDALSAAAFPLNPEIRHGAAACTVEFPAYSNQAKAVRALLDSRGLSDAKLEIVSMLAAIS